ncbi:MAG: copper oxidase [Hydrogenophaga sp.]|uniref:hypothetical protein n=1 Tax=Hydrogenophaga sp. TaxID=1904254 RepID=UPI0016A46247|nr:hypothetical protein [Hydrogenophaga sp.]NIN58494.1 copper oxidase [Xanthomonadales bacterium]NIN55318.1 copper oxidase [Hydrogenophaga sp.]NIO13778.1 copper oxidase [Xanthomonadales bacterium]NIO51623.1 copper oxidase [Hydrogenophaga sp.]NIP10887.1 copper oxidase [Xanthomonadales bacterium]
MAAAAVVRGLLAGLLALAPCALPAQEHAGHAGHAMHRMHMDATGMVMNANDSELPRDCAEIAAEHRFEVEAGADLAAARPGGTFGYSQHEFRVQPCSRITVTLVNRDRVRHQWMVHGLPRYLYPGGMFHLEAAGGHSMTGTFIVPSDDATYLVHCDMPQHMEKGMKAQLVAGAGAGDLWSVPGISGDRNRSPYLPAGAVPWALAALLAGFGAAALALARGRRQA